MKVGDRVYSKTHDKWFIVTDLDPYGQNLYIHAKELIPTIFNYALSKHRILTEKEYSNNKFHAKVDELLR